MKLQIRDALVGILGQDNLFIYHYNFEKLIHKYMILLEVANTSFQRCSS